MSLLVAISGRWQSIIASDSRAVSEIDGSVATDQTVKLIQCGETSICGVVGSAAFIDSAGRYIPTADRIDEMVRLGRLQDEPQKILEAIRADVGPCLTDGFSKLPWDKKTVPFGAFVLRRNVSRMTLLDLAFQADETGTIRNPGIKPRFDGPPSKIFAYASGRGDCLSQDLIRQLNPDLCDEAVINQIEMLFSDAAANEKAENSIGGPVDIAAIGSGAVRWLRRKEKGADTRLCLSKFFIAIRTAFACAGKSTILVSVASPRTSISDALFEPMGL